MIGQRLHPWEKVVEARYLFDWTIKAALCEEGVFEDHKSDRPHPLETINSGLLETITCINK